MKIWCESWNKEYPTEKIVPELVAGSGYKSTTVGNTQAYSTDTPNVYNINYGD